MDWPRSFQPAAVTDDCRREGRDRTGAVSTEVAGDGTGCGCSLGRMEAWRLFSVLVIVGHACQETLRIAGLVSERVRISDINGRQNEAWRTDAEDKRQDPDKKPRTKSSARKGMPRAASAERSSGPVLRCQGRTWRFLGRAIHPAS